MAIKIDVTHISDDLKSVIQNAIKQKSFSGSQDNDYAGNCIKIVLSNDNDRQKVKQLLEDILRKNQINDYIVVDNIKEEDEIAILRKDDLEQLGIFFVHIVVCYFQMKTNASYTNVYIILYNYLLTVLG